MGQKGLGRLSWRRRKAEWVKTGSLNNTHKD